MPCKAREAPARNRARTATGKLPANADRPAPTAEARTMRTREALVLAAGLVAAAGVTGWHALRIANSRSTLTVTGSARRTVRSDLAVWRGSFNAQAPRIQDAYTELAGEAR